MDVRPDRNKNYVVSLSEVTRWLAKRAEALGVEIYSGFAGKNVSYNLTVSSSSKAWGARGRAALTRIPNERNPVPKRTCSLQFCSGGHVTPRVGTSADVMRQRTPCTSAPQSRLVMKRTRKCTIKPRP